MAVKKKNAAAAVAKSQNSGPRYCVYLGPSIRGVIQYGAIIEGTRTEAIQKTAQAIERFPRIKALIVQDVDLAEARLKIKTPGNGLFEINRRFVAELSAGRKGE